MNAEIKEIIAMAETASNKAIARKFGISDTWVSHIVNPKARVCG